MVEMLLFAIKQHKGYGFNSSLKDQLVVFYWDRSDDQTCNLAVSVLAQDEAGSIPVMDNL